MSLEQELKKLEENIRIINEQIDHAQETIACENMEQRVKDTCQRCLPTYYEKRKLCLERKEEIIKEMVKKI